MRTVRFFIAALVGLLAFSPAIPASAEFSIDHSFTGHSARGHVRADVNATQEVVRPANASISTGCPSTPTPGSSVPAFRNWPGIAYDGATANVVLFGGYCYGQNALNDTWTWNGSVWTQMHPASAPAQRFGMGMAYDAAIGKIVLFGGFETTSGGFQGYVNDTWTWDGSNWTQISTAHTPPARSNMGMAYDAGNNVIVLFGGGNGTDMSDTWTFNGTDWSLQKGKGPAARDGQAMVYDPSQPGVILFGGVTAACSTCTSTNFGDTWVWNNGWTQLKPATSPSGREGMGMAYDTFSGYLLLFGGQSEQTPSSGVTMYSDTWTWNGTTWTKLNPVNSPQAQQGFGLEYDANSAARTVVQVGNGTGDGQSGTWIWNGTTWTGMAGIGVPAAEIQGGPSPTEYSTSTQCGCYPVNDATGEFWHSFTDLSIPGRGVSLLFTRTYSSMTASQDSPVGFGWTDSYNIYLSTDTATGNVTVHQSNGSAVAFVPVPSGYQGPARVMATLVKNGDGTFTFTDKGGLRSMFSATGQLTSESDRNGYVTSLAYAGGKLSTIKDPAGRTLTISYGTNGRIASVVDSASRSESFLYDSSGNLTQATDVGGGITKFGSSQSSVGQSSAWKSRA